jgi:translation initiation factor 1
MSNKSHKKQNSGGLVYSTNPDFFKESETHESPVSIPPGKQKLRITLDSKNRRGKTVTLITGFVGSEEEIRKLEKGLKSHCGTGGSSKDGEIIIQGDQREKVTGYLQTKGYTVR